LHVRSSEAQRGKSRRLEGDLGIPSIMAETDVPGRK
jgi:hypothetical protein